MELGANNTENPEEKNHIEKIADSLGEIMMKGLKEMEDYPTPKTSNENKLKNEVDQYNRVILNDLNSVYLNLQKNNSLINEKINSLDDFTKHLDETLEARAHFTDPANHNFCFAVFNLRNSAQEYKLSLMRTMLTAVDKTTVSEPKTRKTEVLDYNRPELNQNQLIFLFNELRKERIITSDLKNVEIARAVEILTGNSEKKFSQKLSGVGSIEFSEKEKEQLKSKLDKLGKAVDSLKSKK